MSDRFIRGRRRRPSSSCPVGACPHPVVLHEIDEIDWPRIERCTVQDCDCSGLALPGLEVAS